MDFSACRSIDVPVVAAVQAGVPVHAADPMAVQRSPTSVKMNSKI